MDQVNEYAQEIMGTVSEVGPPAPYHLNAAVAELLGPDDAEQWRMVLAVWERNGWTTQQQVLDLFDANADLTSIEGIGEKRAPIMAALLQYPDYLFLAVTGLQARDEGQGEALLAPPQKGDDEPAGPRLELPDS